ncbi:unnamed protein product [Anisakis simplex]|uniref:Uncharacterized protein n=1 Tax=Anisakis simplex TaxID=6269 RepID=A0A0M3JEB2_ANISI|nr:unnamed protein product [Anisakis simplex]
MLMRVIWIHHRQHLAMRLQAKRPRQPDHHLHRLFCYRIMRRRKVEENFTSVKIKQSNCPN